MLNDLIYYWYLQFKNIFNIIKHYFLFTLQLLLEPYHFQEGLLVAKCVASMLTMHWQSSDVKIKEESPTLARYEKLNFAKFADIWTDIRKKVTTKDPFRVYA